MFSKSTSEFHFWGWYTYHSYRGDHLTAGHHQRQEYAELEWLIDIAIALVWVAFGINMFGTILKRREQHLYVAIWFYIATWVTVTVLHIGNNLELPVSLWKSYPVFAGGTGRADPVVVWTQCSTFSRPPLYLGLMYYFSAQGNPTYWYTLISCPSFTSGRLFSSTSGELCTTCCIFFFPDWAQSLGTVFSIMLIAPPGEVCSTVC